MAVEASDLGAHTSDLGMHSGFTRGPSDFHLQNEGMNLVVHSQRIDWRLLVTSDGITSGVEPGRGCGAGIRGGLYGKGLRIGFTDGRFLGSTDYWFLIRLGLQWFNDPLLLEAHHRANAHSSIDSAYPDSTTTLGNPSGAFLGPSP